MDLIMGSFADKHVPTYDEDALAQYEELLHLSDPDIYDWICGREQVPDENRSPVVLQLLDHHHAA